MRPTSPWCWLRPANSSRTPNRPTHPQERALAWQPVLVYRRAWARVPAVGVQVGGGVRVKVGAEVGWSGAPSRWAWGSVRIDSQSINNVREYHGHYEKEALHGMLLIRAAAGRRVLLLQKSPGDRASGPRSFPACFKCTPIVNRNGEITGGSTSTSRAADKVIRLDCTRSTRPVPVDGAGRF